MHFQLKVGSVLKVPLAAGMTVASSTPTVASAAITGGFAVITALAAGSTWIMVGLGTDFRAMLDLTVSAT